MYEMRGGGTHDLLRDLLVINGKLYKGIDRVIHGWQIMV